MLYLAAVFLILTVMTGILGFGDVAAGTNGSVARFLSLLFLAAFLGSLAASRRRKGQQR